MYNCVFKLAQQLQTNNDCINDKTVEYHYHHLPLVM